MPENKGTVLYIGGFELPDRNPAAHRVLNNAKILRDLGFRVVFCGVDKEKKAFSENPELVAGFESYPIPYPNSSKQWIKQMCDISAYMSLLEKYSDVKLVIAYNLHALPLAKMQKAIRPYGIKLISDCTEWYENKFSIHPVKMIKWLDTLLCMYRYQKKCDGMIAISHYLADYYKKYIPQVVVLPPLVDIQDKKYQPMGCEEHQVPTLVYCGSPSASKESLGEVVKCLNIMADIPFRARIVGVNKQQFLSMYHVEPDAGKIEFLGRLSHVQSLDIVKASDYSIMIRPQSRVTKAGFPTKFVEAISCGTAVIANDISDLADYLQDGKNGYLVDEKHLQNELADILLNKNIPVIEKDLFDYRKYHAVIAELVKGCGVAL